MKEEDIDKDKIFVSVKYRYKGEHWEIGGYVDPKGLTLSQVEREVEKDIIKSARGMGGVLKREDVAANFLKD